MYRFSLEDLDNLAEYGETAAALTSLGAGTATLVAPNPITVGVAVGSDILGSAIDLYQAGRSLYKNDYDDAAKNAVEFVLGLVGAKAIKEGKKLLEADKALDASNASRQYVTKTIGRGRGKQKLTLTRERSLGTDKISRGWALSTGANVSSAVAGKDFYKMSNTVPSDNTRVVRNYRLPLKNVKGK